MTDTGCPTLSDHGHSGDQMARDTCKQTKIQMCNFHENIPDATLVTPGKKWVY